MKYKIQFRYCYIYDKKTYKMFYYKKFKNLENAIGCLHLLMLDFIKKSNWNQKFNEEVFNSKKDKLLHTIAGSVFKYDENGKSTVKEFGYFMNMLISKKVKKIAFEFCEVTNKRWEKAPDTYLFFEDDYIMKEENL